MNNHLPHPHRYDATMLSTLEMTLPKTVNGSADPISGTGIELVVIGSVILGGTALTGGRGGVVGTLLGVIFLGALANGMNLMGLPGYWQMFVEGVVLIAAVVLDKLVKVTQGSQQRFFMYDSLKRLLRARNPEQATLAVSLDVPGHPVTGQAAWYDLRVGIEKAAPDEAGVTFPQFKPLHAPPHAEATP